MSPIRARILARRLRDEKSDHPWTSAECALLAELCSALDVDKGDDVSPYQRRMLVMLADQDGWIVATDPDPFPEKVHCGTTGAMCIAQALVFRGLAEFDGYVFTATARGRAYLEKDGQG